MPEKTEKSDQMFLEELQKLLRKRSKSPLMGESVQAGSKRIGKERSFKNNDLYSGLPPVTESLLSLVTHLVDLEQRAADNERRGELKPIQEVGRVIRDARKRQGLTVETLADLAEVGPATIYKVEKGSVEVQAPKLMQITRALGLELLVTTR